VAFSAVGYFIQQHLVNFLLKPSHGQQFIYTSPLGGLNFLFQICIYFGLLFSIPMIVYQLFKYMEPLTSHESKTMVFRYSVASGILAVLGGAFGYFMGLPVALGFLGHQFTTAQIKPLLTIQEYMSFVTIYLLGSALLFQLPLIILFINRIKPINPKTLLRFERYMLLVAFVAAAIMTPTTDIIDQLIFAVPIMVMYQVALVLVYLQNKQRRRHYSPEVLRLMEHDAKVQRQRLQFQQAGRRPAPTPVIKPVAKPVTTMAAQQKISDVLLPADDIRNRMRLSAV